MILHHPRNANRDWVDFQRDDLTGIESVQAHFKGHAYDPHDHDELLLGITLQGHQRFNCHRVMHTSIPGKAILIEPGAVHDGHSAQPEGFTYAMLYLPQKYITSALKRRGLGDVSALGATFSHTLTDDKSLITAIGQAFNAFHFQEGRLARDVNFDHLVTTLSRHIEVRPASKLNDSLIQMNRVRDYLHDHMSMDLGLDELSVFSGVDRFRLSRQFKQAFGLSPHAYLVRLRLRAARILLAEGMQPALVATQVGFSDQSHLGRWFQRAYRLTPAAYQRHCTNVLDPNG